MQVSGNSTDFNALIKPLIFFRGTYEACFGYKKNKRPSTSSDLGSFARPQIQAGSITRREPKKNKGICKGTNKACGLGDDPKPKLLQRSFDNETLDPRDAEAEPEAFEEYDDLFIREVEPEAEDPDIFARDADAEAIEDYDDLFARDAEAEAAEAFDDVFARDAEAEAFPDDED